MHPGNPVTLKMPVDGSSKQVFYPCGCVASYEYTVRPLGSIFTGWLKYHHHGCTQYGAWLYRNEEGCTFVKSTHELDYIIPKRSAMDEQQAQMMPEISDEKKLMLEPWIAQFHGFDLKVEERISVLFGMALGYCHQAGVDFNALLGATLLAEQTKQTESIEPDVLLTGPGFHPKEGE